MIRSCIFLLAAAVLLTGCNVPTYINVPNDGDDVAFNNPNHRTVIKLEKAALALVLADSQLPGDVVVRLPEGTRDKVAFEVASSLSDYNVFPDGEAGSGEYHVVEVREIMARGGAARVDIVRPGSLRPRELVEVHLSWSVWNGWVAKRLRIRNIDVDKLDKPVVAPAAKPKDPAVTPVDPESVEPEGDDAADTAGDAE